MTGSNAQGDRQRALIIAPADLAAVVAAAIYYAYWRGRARGVCEASDAMLRGFTEAIER
jgi:hypothetical protein